MTIADIKNNIKEKYEFIEIDEPARYSITVKDGINVIFTRGKHVRPCQRTKIQMAFLLQAVNEISTYEQIKSNIN